MKHLIFVVLILAGAFALEHNKIPRGPYSYDESDYMFAASLGAHNWFDHGTVPFTAFVLTGLRRGSDPNQQAALSEMARAGDDPVLYRHEHGPLYYYWLTIPRTLGLDEQGTRALSLIFPVLTALVMYFGSVALLGGREGQFAGFLSAALFLWSPVTLQTSLLAPHMLFVFLSVCLLFLLAAVETGGGRLCFYAAVFCAGLAFSTMEVVFVPVLVLAVYAWWRRELLGTDRRLLLNSVGIFLATGLVTWPAGLLKLSIVKAYLLMAYLAVFRKDAWGHVTFAGTWLHRFQISPVEWLLLIPALVLLFARTRPVSPAGQRERRIAIMFGLFAGIMILATLRILAEGPRYMTPFMAALDLFIAWMVAPALARLPKPWLRSASLAAVVLVVFLSGCRQMSVYLLREDTGAARALTAIRAGGLSDKRILASREDIPMLHYYFPRMHVQGYSALPEIAERQRAGHFDAVLYPDYSLKTRGDGPP
jgi:hypothetical protein